MRIRREVGTYWLCTASAFAFVMAFLVLIDVLHAPLALEAGLGGMLAVGGLFGFYFRSPLRRIPRGNGMILAPADGRICRVRRMTAEEMTALLSNAGLDAASGALPAGEAYVRLTIRPGLLSVRMARQPISGRCLALGVAMGGRGSTRRASSSDENERAFYRIDDGSHVVLLVELAGIQGRTMAYLLDHAGRLSSEAGTVMGLPGMGSALDVYIPERAARICIAQGQVVRGSESVLARFVDTLG